MQPGQGRGQGRMTPQEMQELQEQGWLTVSERQAFRRFSDSKLLEMIESPEGPME